MPTPGPINRLRAIVAELDAAGSEHAAWFGSALADYERRPADQDFGAVLGLNAAPVWWRLEALARRDDAIRQLAERLPGGRRGRGAVAEVCKRLKRYEASAWRFDRHAADLPADSDRALMATVLRVGDPPAERQLRTIIRCEKSAICLGVPIADWSAQVSGEQQAGDRK
jgi:hypothetical protein